LLPNGSSNPRKPKLGGMAMMPVPSGTHVLVADDDDLVSDVITMALESHGYRVTQVAGGRIDPDQPVHARLAILDARVPGRDFATTRRALVESGVHVLVISGEATPPDGVADEDFLSKPIDLDQLLSAVGRLASAPGA
jgi:DNA-binding response OmpR family regulator